MGRPIGFKELIKNDKELQNVLEFYCKQKDYATILELIMSKVMATVVEKQKPVNLGYFILESYRQKWKSGIVGEEIESIVLRVRATKKFKDYAKEVLETLNQEEQNGVQES